MRLIFFLAFSLIVGVSADAETSLDAPISVVLSEVEVVRYESMLCKGRFDSKDFVGVLVFEGVVIAARNPGNGETIYRFKVKRTLKPVARRNVFSGLQVEVIAPADPSNGGINLTIGKLYRVGAPVLPDGRYGVWRGIVVDLNRTPGSQCRQADTGDARTQGQRVGVR